MSVRPEQLFDQAARLVRPHAGRANAADLRRAISAAYYALLHTVLTAAADEFVGRTKMRSVEYNLVYRSVDHRAIRELCGAVRKSTVTARYARSFPSGGFAPSLQDFAASFNEMQERRHLADYDPSAQPARSDAEFAIALALRAAASFAAAPAEQRRRFLALLLFPPR